MRKKTRRTANRILTWVISLLGFSTSCNLLPEVEYGTPHATFRVNGTVRSAESGEVIPNIRVVMEYDSTQTDAEGKYALAVEDWPDDQTFAIQFLDTDGATNGSFANVDTSVVFTDPQFTGGDGHWNEGSVETEFNIDLPDEAGR
ncbi:MAG: radical SAM-associated putative lipoprotein [Bacteroidales bacterium]